MERLKLNIQKFATSGSCTSSTVSAYGVDFSVTVYWNRVSTWNGTTCGSKINWWARVNTQGSGYTRTVTGGQVYINGTPFNVATGSFGDGSSIASGNNFAIQHNNNGTKSFNIKIDVQVGGSAWSYTEKSFTLDTIPRTSRIDSFTFDTDSQNRPNNIEEDFNVSFTRYDNNFTDNLIIQYLDRADTNDYVAIKTITNYTSGSSANFIASELNDLYSSATVDNDIFLRVYLETYSGNTKIGESDKATLTAKLYDADPVFSDFDVQDINSTTTMLTEGISPGTVNQVINVNGYSNIQVTISSANKAVALKGATITKYRFVCGSKSVDIAYSDSASVSGTIIGAENGTYVVYAIDNRGNNTPITKLATSIKEYTPLKIDTTVGNNIKAERDNGGVGSNCTLTFSGEIWNNSFGSVSNSFKSAKYYLKKTDSSTWIDLGSSMTDITPTITNGTFSFSNTIRSDNADTTWDIGSSYDIKVVLEDKLSSVEVQTILASAIPTISLSKNGVGIMCDFDDSLGGYLQVDGKSFLDYLYPVGAIYTSVNPTSPQTLFGGTWERIKGKFLLSADEDEHWVYIAKEGSSYTFTESATIRYGITGKWKTKTVSAGTYTLNSSFFGGDPASGSAKHTEILIKTTGGSTSGEYYHKLTVPELASHNHLQYVGANSGSWGVRSDFTGDNRCSNYPQGNTGNTGSDASHNNMPPYLAVYMWQRTA